MRNEERRAILKGYLDEAKKLGYKTFICKDETYAYGTIATEEETMGIQVNNWGQIGFTIKHRPCREHGSALSIVDDVFPSEFNLEHSITKALLRFGWSHIKKEVVPMGLEDYKKAYGFHLVEEY